MEYAAGLTAAQADGKMPMDSRTKTYAKKKIMVKKTVARPVTPVAKPAAPMEESAPFGQAMQSLMSLAGMMRNMNPESAGAGNNPKLVLTGTGLEIRFAEAAGEAAEPLAPRTGKVGGVSADWFARIEQTLEELRRSNAELEEQVATQAEVIDSLRATVQQNEEMMETLVDSMNMVDDLSTGHGELGPALVFGPETIAS